jgi:hypothetical protein
MPLIFGSERRLAPFLEWETEGREEREESSTPTVYHDDGVVDCLNGAAPAPSDAGGKKSSLKGHPKGWDLQKR